MRLIDTSSLQLVEFTDDDVPVYAILSHTWGKDEVRFEDFPGDQHRPSAGLIKIQSCCSLANSKGWDFLWIDTCCIDKKSSAELSEAINSMYRWYKEAAECFVYLADVSLPLNTEPRSKLDESFRSAFRKARWFTRGWTLQELLAPAVLNFYDKDWREIGSKTSLEADICLAAKITVSHLKRPQSANIAVKMSWASERQTTRKEDIAYCLLGLFNINLPLLYGEGMKAFSRLQHEIIKTTVDESIFAWKNDTLWTSGMFAQSPLDFKDSGDIVLIWDSQARPSPYALTNLGLEIERDLSTADSTLDECGDVLMPLRCVRLNNKSARLHIHLQFFTPNIAPRMYPHSLPALSMPLLHSGRRRRYFIPSWINRKTALSDILIVREHTNTSMKSQNAVFVFNLSRTITQNALDVQYHSSSDANMMSVRYDKLRIIQGQPNEIIGGKFSALEFSDIPRAGFNVMICWRFSSSGDIHVNAHCHSQENWDSSRDCVEKLWRSSSGVQFMDRQTLSLACGKGDFVWVMPLLYADVDDVKCTILVDMSHAIPEPVFQEVASSYDCFHTQGFIIPNARKGQ